MPLHVSTATFREIDTKQLHPTEDGLWAGILGRLTAVQAE